MSAGFVVKQDTELIYYWERAPTFEVFVRAASSPG